MEIIFWVAAGLVLLNLVVLPAAIIGLSYVFGRPVAVDPAHRPPLTVLITAHNEEKHITEKIRNTLAFEYPPERLEILIALDGCTDRTAEIAEAFGDDRIRVIRYPRLGKTAVQDAAATEARGEIIYFTDATAYHNPEAARLLVAHCADGNVGCATGWHGFTNPSGAGATGVGVRLAYELLLRRRMGVLYSMLGAAGCNMAMPKRYVQQVGKGLNHDWAAPILALMQGKRTVFVPDAKAFLPRPLADEDELKRRTRIVAQALRGVYEIPESLNVLKHPMLALGIVFLRLLKWYLPIPLVAMLVSNAFLLDATFYRITFGAQVAFVAAGLLGALMKRRGRVPAILSVPFYFCLLNLAALRGIWAHTRGETFTTWQATAR